jgi:hypothetical protein
MAYFAELDDNNTVLRVISVSNADAPDLAPEVSEPLGQAFIASIGLAGRWVQTSYNGTFRGRYAGIGYTYDPIDDRFIAPQPYPSWTLDANGNWQAPTPYPDDGGMYVWDEETLAWVELDDPTSLT